MKRKIILTVLVTSFMLLTIAGYQDAEHNYQPAQHGEM